MFLKSCNSEPAGLSASSVFLAEALVSSAGVEDDFRIVGITIKFALKYIEGFTIKIMG